MAVTPQPWARRELEGTSLALSPVSLTVDTDGWAADPQGIVQLLRRARAAGVSTFDTAGAREPAVAEMLLARAFPDGDPEIVVITAPTEAGRAAPRASPAMDARAIRPARRFDAPTEVGRFARLEELPPPSSPPKGAERSTTRPPSGEGGPSVHRCSTGAEVDAVLETPPPWRLIGPFSLLNPRLAWAARARADERSMSWIARDALAGGRLDGSRFLPDPGRPGTPPPASVRDLQGEIARIAPLGFLARPGERTLAQAALRYLLDLPWVATVCLPIPDPRRWTELFGYAQAPPLTGAERERVLRLADPSEGTP